MKPCIIGIAGAAGAGKDTIASMINYIRIVGTSRANYREYVMNKTIYDEKLSSHIIHFADALKDCLSIIYNIPREYFDDRVYKDDLYYCMSEKRFIESKRLNNKYHTVINIEDLEEVSLAQYHNVYDDKICIKLRTLMQYFGTNVCRTTLGDNIWINSTINKACNVAERTNYCIIPDVRFNNEADSLRRLSLYGVLVMVQRQTDSVGNHSSEQFNFIADHVIDNNSTKINLFYKTLEVCQNLI